MAGRVAHGGPDIPPGLVLAASCRTSCPRATPYVRFIVAHYAGGAVQATAKISRGFYVISPCCGEATAVEPVGPSGEVGFGVLPSSQGLAALVDRIAEASDVGEQFVGGERGGVAADDVA